jgi:hypothetical protein
MCLKIWKPLSGRGVHAMYEANIKGRVLRVKRGYNPNSSSMGSIIFALPASMVAVTFGLAAVSGLILPHFIKEKGPKGPAETDNSPEGNSES